MWSWAKYVTFVCLCICENENNSTYFIELLWFCCVDFCFLCFFLIIFIGAKFLLYSWFTVLCFCSTELLRLNELISGRSPGVGIGSEVKVSASNAGDLGSIPGSGRSPGEGNGISHSSILAWRIPWMEKPGRLQSTESQRVGHDWATSLYFTSVFLPGKSHGWRSLPGYRP